MTDREASEMREDLADLKARVRSLEKEQEKLVKREEFTPVKQIVFGMAAAVLIAVLQAMLSNLGK